MSVSAVVFPAPDIPLPAAGRSLDTSVDSQERSPQGRVEAILASLPHSGTVIVLSAGPEPLVQDVSVLALPGRTVPVTGAAGLVARIVARGQVPRVQASSLGGAGARLAAAIHAVRPELGVVGVTVPAGADPAAFRGAVTALHGALGSAERVVLAADGDLGAAEEGGPHDPPTGTPTAAFATLVVAALRATDVPGLEALSAARPDRARDLAPLRLALGIVTDRGGRFHVHAAEEVDGRLHVIGSAR